MTSAHHCCPGLEEEARRLFWQLLNTVAHCHLHLKCENILLDDRGFLKLTGEPTAQTPPLSQPDPQPGLIFSPPRRPPPQPCPQPHLWPLLYPLHHPPRTSADFGFANPTGTPAGWGRGTHLEEPVPPGASSFMPW